MQPLERRPSGVQGDFGHYLLDAGLISPSALMAAVTEARRLDTSVERCLRQQSVLTPDEIVNAHAAFLRLPLIDLTASPPDQTLSALFDPGVLLRYAIIPWQKNNGQITLLASCPESYRDFLAHHVKDRSKFTFAFAEHDKIIDWITTHHKSALRTRASARVSEDFSCRTWQHHTSRKRLVMTILALLAFVGVIAAFPRLALGILTIWAVATLIISAVMRLVSYIAEMSKQPEQTPPTCPEKDLPRISVMVPLFKEREIATALLVRLKRLTYPKALLDVILVVEENDELTQEVLRSCELPPWLSVVEVPEGVPKTKPRAMNYALDFCKGDIVGVWDAEDAPAADQLHVVADYFHSAGEDLVCLQGVLDYYNSRQNWLARCFTIEYAAWFRLILPGMARLGFIIPLGGTTLFFRRDALEKLGGWDAHNVTEDADLGFRLARYGYRTDVIPTRTGEEAVCRLWPWVRQRSRWLKGYMVTYLVHMRSPRRLMREIGVWRFCGVQAHFVTALSQFILAPILWSFWLVLLGLPHPLEAFVSRDILLALGASFLVIELINALINATAVSRPTLRHLFIWVPTMHFYYPLGAMAAYKALLELLVKPFYWDKTQHGHSLKALENGVRNTPSRLRPGVKLEARNEGF